MSSTDGDKMETDGDKTAKESSTSSTDPSEKPDSASSTGSPSFNSPSLWTIKIKTPNQEKTVQIPEDATVKTVFYQI